MRGLLLAFVLCLSVCACSRYPSHLPDSYQLQAVLFDDMARRCFESVSGDDDALGLFLSCGDPEKDPPRSVVSYVAQAFRSARPRSAAGPRTGEGIFEKATGRQGISLHLSPFVIADHGPFTVEAEHSAGGKSGGRNRYRVERAEGQWRILACEKTAVY